MDISQAQIMNVVIVSDRLVNSEGRQSTVFKSQGQDLQSVICRKRNIQGESSIFCANGFTV